MTHGSSLMSTEGRQRRNFHATATVLRNPRPTHQIRPRKSSGQLCRGRARRDHASRPSCRVTHSLMNHLDDAVHLPHVKESCVLRSPDDSALLAPPLAMKF
jgi:hypothetical protein